MLKNLLSNAFKFTEQGGVQLVGLGRRPVAGARTIPSWQRRIGCCVSRSPIPVSAFHRRSSESFSRRFNRQTPAPAANTAEPVWAGDQPRVGQPAWRRNSVAQHARKRQHVHAVFAANLCRSVRDHAGHAERRTVIRCRVSCQPVSARAARSNVSPMIVTNLQPDDAILLIVEDDPHYARVLCDLVARQGIQSSGRHARRGGTGAGAASSIPRRSRSMFFLPDMLGWTVLNHLKQDPAPGTFLSRC